jgi:hypothetical protein
MDTTTNDDKIESIFQRPQDMIFFNSWLENGCNAQKAYKRLHPDVSDGSASVLGSRQLGKVRITDILSVYGLGVERYVEALRDGLQAVRIDANGVTGPDYKARQYYHQTLGRLMGLDKYEESKDAGYTSEVFRRLREQYTKSD